MAGVVLARGRSEPANAALHFAVDEADLRHQPLSLVHVWDLPIEVSIDLDGSLAAEFGATSTATATHGPLKSALLAQRPELLVLARNPRDRRLTRLIRTFVRHAPCPVVIAPTDLGAEPHLERIVVGVSYTPASIAALRWAADEATLHGVRLAVLHAWQKTPTARALVHPREVAAAHCRAEQQRRLRHWVDHAIATPHAETIAAHGAPFDILINAAAATDLIVVGRPHHTPGEQILHGRLGDDLALHAPCPVAVVPPAQHHANMA